MKKKLSKILIAVAVLVLCLYGVKKVVNKFGINVLEKSNIETNYDHEWDNMSKEDEKIIKKAISLAKEKVKMEYVWGGKGEIMTEERLDELIGYYGQNQYPLDKKKYIGKQAFEMLQPYPFAAPDSTAVFVVFERNLNAVNGVIMEQQRCNDCRKQQYI